MNETQKLLQDLLADYGRSIGIENLQPDIDHFCSLKFGEDVVVTIQSNEATSHLVISSDVGTIAPAHRSAVCELLLEANFAWEQTGGLGTLALAPNDDPFAPSTAVLMYQTPFRTLDFAEFRTLMTRFVETAEGWLTYLRPYAIDGPLPDIDPSQDGDAGPGFSFLRV